MSFCPHFFFLGIRIDIKMDPLSVKVAHKYVQNFLALAHCPEVPGVERDEMLLRVQLALLYNTLANRNGDRTWPVSAESICRARSFGPIIKELELFDTTPSSKIPVTSSSSLCRSAVVVKRHIIILIATLHKYPAQLCSCSKLEGATGMQEVVEIVKEAGRESPVPKLRVKKNTPPPTPVFKKSCSASKSRVKRGRHVY